jgi:hypothetical protein
MEEDDRNSIYSLGEKRNEVDIKDLIMAAYGHHEVRERVHVPLMFSPDSKVSRVNALSRILTKQIHSASNPLLRRATLKRRHNAGFLEDSHMSALQPWKAPTVHRILLGLSRGS